MFEPKIIFSLGKLIFLINRTLLKILVNKGFLKIKKEQAFHNGPLHHGSGHYVVDIINKAANYWKHYPEWPLEKNESRKQSIIKIFADLGFPVDSEYPLSGILVELTEPEETRFMPLAKALESWREALRNFIA